MVERAGLYVDAFNLYHAVEDLGQDHLKWLDMWALGQLLIPKQSQTLVRVVWCTAVKTKGDVKKMLRHREYMRALKGRNVEVLEGHFSEEDRDCRDCGRQWKAPIEKQSDVNLALSLVDDGYRDIVDHAYLLTADSDQAAAAALFRSRFPAKTLTTICPPGRSHSKEILQHANGKIALTQAHLERCLLPKTVMGTSGPVAKRDPVYDPPAGWKPPT